MRIILKPKGVLFLGGALLFLSAFAYKGMQMLGPTPSPTPVAAVASPGEASTWKANPTEGEVDASGLGSVGTEFALSSPLVKFRPGQARGAFSVKVRCAALGSTSQFPKYGIRVTGVSAADYIEAWIDPRTGVLATVGSVKGLAMDWRNSPLPAGFDMTQNHELRMEWSENGKKWRCLVDGDKAGRQEDQFADGFVPQRLALKVEDAQASYSGIKVE